MEEAEREEEEGEEEEEESLKELELEEEEIAMATGAGGLGWFLCYWLWEEDGVFCGEEPIRGRLNSEKVEDGSAVFTFYEEPVAETLRLPWWLQQF